MKADGEHEQHPPTATNESTRGRHDRILTVDKNRQRETTPRDHPVSRLHTRSTSRRYSTKTLGVQRSLVMGFRFAFRG
jgi:hypothetical protein